ncbi:hypothetical protein G7Y89_g9168 [Cudoniella acicularis]|uniref:Heterokaryon incompatibility domain-containing protein n=1 Tax=Cudoniella acicularis TaxID=354080 RepID=A0A8H4RGQ9_9HELO|nr:hypothetical protein G7Y89_g9168 [Cudoniella acicularis]
MSSYLGSIKDAFTGAVKKTSNVLQGAFTGEGEIDGDTINETHLGTILVKYYQEKNITKEKWPQWLPPNPKHSTEPPSSENVVGAEYGVGMQIASSKNVEWNTLWEPAPQAPQNPQGYQSRRTGPNSQQPNRNFSDSRSQAPQKPQAIPRPLPSQKVSSYQKTNQSAYGNNTTAPAVIPTKERLKGKFGGTRPTSSRSASSQNSSASMQNSYNSGGGGNYEDKFAPADDKPFLGASAPWANNDSEFTGAGYDDRYDRVDNVRSGGGRVAAGSRGPGLPSGPRGRRRAASQAQPPSASQIFTSSRKFVSSSHSSIRLAKAMESISSALPEPSKTPYSPLQDENEIRLIYLLPGPASDEIKCEVKHALFSPELRYEALSYMWGPRDIQKSIEVNGVVMDVRENLWHALCHLHLDDQVRILWIDTICINKSDIHERNHQVAQMGRIYKSASEVVVWLGLPDADSSLAFGVLADPSRWNELFIQQPTIQVNRSRMLSAIYTLFTRDYWKRLWIIQEILLASKLLAYCGNDTCSWFRTFQYRRSTSRCMSLLNPDYGVSIEPEDRVSYYQRFGRVINQMAQEFLDPSFDWNRVKGTLDEFPGSARRIAIGYPRGRLTYVSPPFKKGAVYSGLEFPPFTEKALLQLEYLQRLKAPHVLMNVNLELGSGIRSTGWVILESVPQDLYMAKVTPQIGLKSKIKTAKADLKTATGRLNPFRSHRSATRILRKLLSDYHQDMLLEENTYYDSFNTSQNLGASTMPQHDKSLRLLAQTMGPIPQYLSISMTKLVFQTAARSCAESIALANTTSASTAPASIDPESSTLARTGSASTTPPSITPPSTASTTDQPPNAALQRKLRRLQRKSANEEKRTNEHKAMVERLRKNLDDEEAKGFYQEVIGYKNLAYQLAEALLRSETQIMEHEKNEQRRRINERISAIKLNNEKLEERVEALQAKSKELDTIIASWKAILPGSFLLEDATMHDAPDSNILEIPDSDADSTDEIILA